MFKKRLYLAQVKTNRPIPKKNPLVISQKALMERFNELKKNNELNQIENVGDVIKNITFPTIGLDDIISNERIIRISDWTWGGSLGKFRIKNLMSPNRLVNKGDIISIRTNNLENLYKSLNKFIEPIILLSNYSDKTVDHTYKFIADHPKIYHWFAINCTLDHPKVTKIPLGLGASHNAFGNLFLLSELIQKKHSQPNRKILINYKIDRLRPARLPLTQCLVNQGFTNNYGMTVDQYWKSIINHEFILSPPGCGIDCYRIWETLYLGRIPVVIKNPALMDFKNLPILFVDNYDDLYNKLRLPTEWINKEFNWNLLKFTYWFNLIQKKKRECLGIIEQENIVIPPLIETEDLNIVINNPIPHFDTSLQDNNEVINEVIYEHIDNNQEELVSPRIDFLKPFNTTDF